MGDEGCRVQCLEDAGFQLSKGSMFASIMMGTNGWRERRFEYTVVIDGYGHLNEIHTSIVVVLRLLLNRTSVWILPLFKFFLGSNIDKIQFNDQLSWGD